jgi:nicotinamide-nucleotide amidase
MDSHILPPDVYELAQRVIDENKAIGRTVTVAESCTGGLVAAALTEIPGSSAVFHCGFTTYSNDAKIGMLDVPQDLIAVRCRWRSHGPWRKARWPIAMPILR